MGTSSYNGTNTGFGASTSEGSRAGYTSIDKSGTKNVKFNVGGQNEDLKGRSKYGYEFLLNGIDSKLFTTGNSIINWVQPKLTTDGITTGNLFSTYYTGNSVDSTFLVYHLFDGDSSTYGYIGLTSDGSYSVYYNPVPFRITQLVYSGVYDNDTANYGLTHIVIAGSDDATTWTTLKDADISSTTIDLSSNTSYYKYYKISGSVASGGKFPAYASCSITATMKFDSIGNDTYNIFVSEDGESAFETGEFYRQPDLNLNIVKHGNLTEEISKSEITETGIKYYKYQYSTFTQPTLASDGTWAGNSFATKFTYTTRTSGSSTAYQGFNPNAGYIDNYREEAYTTEFIWCYNPNPIRLTSYSFDVGYYSGTNSSNAYNVYLYASNDDSEYVQIGYVSYIAKNTSYTFTITDSNYYKFFKLEARNGGANYNDYLRIKNIKLVGEERETINGTESDYDFYVKETPRLNVDYYNFSNFSADNYLKLPEVFNPTTNSWEMLFHVKTPSTIGNYSTIIGSGISTNYQGIALQINTEGKLALYLSSNGTSWNIGTATSSSALATDTWYYIRLKYSDGNYTVGTSTDGTIYTTVITIASSTAVYTSSDTLAIGLLVSDGNYYRSVIDLYHCYIKIGSDYFWTPVIDGTIWEDTSKFPVTCWKYNNSTSTWNEYNNIYLGSVEISNGSFVAVKNEPFNSFNTTFANQIKPASIIDSGILNSSGNFYNQSWYNLYSDGWLEQGVNFNQTASGTKTFTFIKPFKDLYYNVASSGTVSGITRNTKNIVVTHGTGTGDFIVSGYTGSSGVVRKYYKYYYETFNQPLLTSSSANTSQGTFAITGRNRTGTEYIGGNAWYSFATTSGYTSPYYSGAHNDNEGSIDYHIYISMPKISRMTSYSFYTPYTYNYTGDGLNYGYEIRGSNNNSTWTQIYRYSSRVYCNTTTTVNISTDQYYKYYLLSFYNGSGSYHDGLSISSIRLGCVLKYVGDGTPEDYDYYEDVEG